MHTSYVPKILDIKEAVQTDFHRKCLPFTWPRASIENIPQLIFHGPYALALLGFPAVTYGHW